MPNAAESAAPGAAGRGAGRRRAARLAAAALAGSSLLLVSWAAAHAWLGRPAALGRLRVAAERAVRERLPAGRLGDEAAIDWLGRLVIGPLEVPARRPGAPPLLRVERILVRPSWSALLRGRAQAATVSLRGVRVEAGPGGEEVLGLARRIEAPRRRGGSGSSAAAPPDIGLEDASLGVGGRTWLGPLAARLSFGRDGGGAVLRFPGGGRGRVRIERAREAAAVHVSLSGLSPADLPVGVRDALPVEIAGGRLSARVDVDGLADARSGVARVEAAAAGLVVAGEGLAPGPVGPVRVALRGVVRWDAARRRLALEGARLALGEAEEVPIDLWGELVLDPEARFSTAARVDGLDLAAAKAALPPALVPEGDLPLVGPLGARLAVAGPLHRPAEWMVTGALDLSGTRRAARAAGPCFLAGPFVYRPDPDAGPARRIVVGPENPAFVPLAELPTHVVRAVTTSEDAGFFSHEGFDLEEIRNAVAEGRDGRLRGASTITQQLAKNLFLSQERTLARKVREALLTVELESSLPKARLLEIYLNVVEWGPGVYGIGEAARHYFGKDARRLSPREAAFLAAVIPSPVRYHSYYARGAIPESFVERIDGLLLKMREAGQLSDQQLQEALREPLAFARG